MTKRFLTLSVFSVLLFLNSYSFAQNTVEKHTVFLLGNTGLKQDNNLQNLKKLKTFLANFKEDFTVLHLGDIVNNTGDITNLSTADKGKLDILLSLAENPNGKIYFLPGDLDWDNSGKNGQKHVEALHAYIEENADESVFLLPKGSCPGPTVLDIAPHIRLIAFNSQWWIHPFEKPISTDTECKVLVKEELIDEITDAIDDTHNKNILIASHHPVFSGGIYGGYSTPKMHLFPNESKIPMPIAGSFYTAYRQNVGTPKDMAYPTYHALTTELKKYFIYRKGLIFASAHDYNLQVIRQNNNYQLVSGSIMQKEPFRKTSGTIYSEKEFGLLALEYYPDGKVNRVTYLLEGNTYNALGESLLFDAPCASSNAPLIPENYHYTPCQQDNTISNTKPTPNEVSKVVSAGKEYSAGATKKLFLGNLYRKSWVTPVNVEYLDLETKKGGLTPYTVGGGRQTTSLKFRAANGKTYTFRSVNKDPIKALPPQLRETVIVSLVRELTATQHPYGALPVSRLLDATDILHARPQLYVLPDHPRLGTFRNKYHDLFGMLEDDPKKPKDGVPGFQNADDVDRSFTMFRKVYDDNDTYVDAKSFAKARIFDMLIGDWGRHPDNWKWALYDKGDKEVFYPIPRDRDHSFSRWNGLIPYLADREWGRPNVENFDYKFKGVRSLNWPARHLDRLLLTSLEKADWLNITNELQNEITETVIDSAIQAFPEEIIPVSGEEIGKKLKSRRSQLTKAVTEHYLTLAKEVDVVGSNKHEYFLAERLDNGNVIVKVFKKKKEQRTLGDNTELIYERTFVKAETNEIRFYGLDGEDVFHIIGNVPESIKIRIIGGDNKDVINDESSVEKRKKYTIVYDNTNTQLTEGQNTLNKLADQPNINLYDRQAFKYNTYLPLPLLSFNADDGIGFKFGVDWTRHSFRVEPFKQKYGFDVKVGTAGTRSLRMYSEWTNVFGKWSFGVDGTYADIFPFYNFFELGNETVKENRDQDFFRTNYKGLDLNIYTRKRFWVKSFFTGKIRLEDYQSVIRENTILEGSTITGTNPLTILGMQGDLDIDFRNGDVYATKGLRFKLTHQSGWLLNESSEYFNLSEAFGEYYTTMRILTLAFKLGGAKNMGDNIPYFKYANLGQQTNLRGFLRNRFAGTANMYFNTEARLPIGTVKNPIFPFVIGVTGFFDTGRVWYEDPETGNDPSIQGSDDTWHQGFGGGFYLVPVFKQYTLSVSAATSKEESILLIVGLGFGIGR
ncbi:MAG: hypothetical protein AAGI07_13105 [Bacteroidota bacterium]